MINSKVKIFLKSLGPGILFASMAIGTSHLVLSTKAGATYGIFMAIPIALANILKYPFFEFGVRYTQSTETSLIEGYSRRGKTYLYLYGLITLVSTFTVLSALYSVTTGLLANLMKWNEIPLEYISAGLFLFITALLVIGRYKFLEQALKIIISVLFFALLATTIMVVNDGKAPVIDAFEAPKWFDKVSVLFLISLVGWMPTAVEASGWVSMWSLEKMKSKSFKPNFTQAMREFVTGYWLTAILAFFFLIMGYYTLYGSGNQLSESSVAFANDLVELFTVQLGNWAYALIATAAFATMFSTCMTAHDAVARVSNAVLQELKWIPKKNSSIKLQFAIMVIVLGIVNWVVINVFSSNMMFLVGLATSTSFVFAPIIGYMNLKNIKGEEMKPEHRPSKQMILLTYTGMFFLGVFALYYLYLQFS